MIANFSLSLLLTLMLFQVPGAAPSRPSKETGKDNKPQAKASAKNKKAAKVEAPPSTADAKPSATPNPCPYTVEEAPAQPMVVPCIHSAKDTNFEHLIRMNNPIERGNNITVPILGLKAWMDRNKGINPRDLRLFISGHLLPTDPQSSFMVDQGYINFQLTGLSSGSDSAEKSAWILIFIEARRQPNGIVPLSVGLPKELQPFASEAFISLRVYPWYTRYVVVGLVLLLIAVFALGWQSDLLRDVTHGRPPAPARAPYSMGRVQMAWWFCLVISAYVYICLITKEINILTGTAMALIGISAGTGLASVFVDTQKIADEENQKISLQSERGVVQARIAVLTAAAPAAGTPEALELQDRQKRLAEINALLNKFPAVHVIPSSKGFLDILKDGEGLSFHRFQIAVWTVVLGLVFIKSAFLDLVMPEFDATLLGLMGISSGTYIGFKFPEK
ncbi:MAG: hypothetical protein ACJ71U_01365 [Terriglobales bacterium]